MYRRKHSISPKTSSAGGYGRFRGPDATNSNCNKLRNGFARRKSLLSLRAAECSIPKRRAHWRFLPKPRAFPFARRKPGKVRCLLIIPRKWERLASPERLERTSWRAKLIWLLAPAHGIPTSRALRRPHFKIPRYVLSTLTLRNLTPANTLHSL